ncbi:MAG: exo-alpha-sialidase [Clostridia bacterium]|nr:exo-alpha-sialidase [Clostridia bacterium]
MKTHKQWSYAPYKPVFFDDESIYICRIAPGRNYIHFEWLTEGESTDIYFRKRDTVDFEKAGSTDKGCFDIKNLEDATDYEFYVQSGEKKSRIRLARTGEAVGTVVNYLHPDDEVYSFSGRYLCSPSMVKFENGVLLVSMDLYAGAHPQNLTLIFRSDDNGETWHYVSELFPCFWGKLFIHKNELYMLSCSTEYGDLLIGKSTDMGKTFSEPVVLMRGSNGKNGDTGVHKNPQPVVYHRGRIWNTLEWGSWGQHYHAPMVMSAPENSDLMEADSWSFSYPVKYNPEWEGLPKGRSTGNIEGCLVELDDGFYNIMRYDMGAMEKPNNYGKVVAYRVDTDNPENSLTYSHCIDFPANHSKFQMKYDSISGKFYSVATRILNSENAHSRNLLSLMISEDCKNWEVHSDLLDYRNEDPKLIGFQYVDFMFDGDDIIYACRTAINNAHSFHDSNYTTFHRIKNFRK